MGILDTLFKRPPPTLSIIFHPNSLIQYHKDIKAGTILEVKQGQSAYLIGQEPKIFYTGDYALTGDILKAPSGDILFFNHGQVLKQGVMIYQGARVKRNWHSLYQPSDRHLKNPLAGKYFVSIDSPLLLGNFLTHSAADYAPNDHFIDQWIAYIIDEALIKAGVTASDIAYRGQDLHDFINDLLNHALPKQGLAFHNAYIVQDAPRKKETDIVSESQPAQTVVPETMPAEAAPEVATPPPELPDDEKLFYRFRKGEQTGPYSIAEIQQFIDQGHLSPKEKLWKKGLRSWERADSFGLFTWND